MSITDGPLPAIHPRTGKCELAKRKLHGHMVDVVEEFGLTHAEQSKMVASLFGEWLVGIANCEIRRERGEL